MSANTQPGTEEAAMEEIFSSDGLGPPVVISPPPVKLPEAKPEEEDTAVLDTSGLAAEDAFEVFAGKLFPLQTAGLSTSSRGKETPWQRLARLQREVQELEKDVTPLSASEDDGPTGAGATETSLLEAVRGLQVRLSEPSTTAVAAASSRTAFQQQLSQKVADSTAALNESSTSAAAGGGATDVTVGSATSSSAHDNNWDVRIRKLESVVGTGAAGGLDDGHSLMERLDVLERAAAKLSDKDLDLAAKKAKVIRQDLEAASKARNKLVSSRDANAESSKSIAALHDQLTQLQGLTNLLPALTKRLQVLASQHSQATTWTQRLTATEQQASQLQTATAKLDSLLMQLEQSLQDTATQMTENMKALDDKLS